MLRLIVLCGSGGRLDVQHAADWTDGWVPMDSTLGDVPAGITKLREAAFDAGRDAESIPISIVAIGDPTVKTLAATATWACPG